MHIIFMVWFFRIGIAVCLSYFATSLLYPHYYFRVEHLENSLVSNFYLSWIAAPIFARLLIGSLYVLAFFILTYAFKKKYLYFIAPVLLVIPFLINPVYPKNFKNQGLKINKPLAKSLQIDKKEAYLMAFFSSNCIYCAEGSRRLSAAQKTKKTFIPVHVFTTITKIDTFFKITNSKFPYTIIEKDTFLKYTEGSFPKYALIQNDTIKTLYSTGSLNYYALKEFSNYKTSK